MDINGFLACGYGFFSSQKLAGGRKEGGRKDMEKKGKEEREKKKGRKDMERGRKEFYVSLFLCNIS